MTDREAINEVSLALAAQDLPTALDKFIDAGLELVPRLRADGQAYMAELLAGLMGRMQSELVHARARAIYGAQVVYDVAGPRVPKLSPATGAGATGGGLAVEGVHPCPPSAAPAAAIEGA
jgi:hypothetical protein